MNRIAVIGGGPSGMLAACTAAKNDCLVTIYERNEKLGKKLYITGKGRCNVTNNATEEEFFANIPRNHRFMYSSFYSFTNHDLIRLLNTLGLETKVERGGRVFPASDKSSDVLKVLTNYVRQCNAEVLLNTRVKSISKTGDNKFSVRTNNGDYTYDSVIIATGGVSYPTTGSDGDGYRFASELGIKTIDAKPALVPLVTIEEWPKELMGLTLKNVTLRAFDGNKKVFEDMGEVLFTHFGISGPLVLTLSSIIAEHPENVKVFIDLKPALTREELDRRVLRDFQTAKNKQMKNALFELMPSSLVQIILQLAQIDPDLAVNSLTKQDRARLVEIIKAIPLVIKGTRPIEEAIITRGGIDTREINPTTMESKKVSGLYFSGEVIDVDAFTGGFNLQIAFSTGYLAGRSASEK
ncbi:MAG: NAD(P)/FAD-dependent oxidoreductase [Clostridiales bacterium]|nr:NAD(P)/FAD-dependent oxidoreductase [Clostridiales bacterium]MDD7550257.1 NAD(P)/FAD-dependent oxidoreductase [Clostridia bacterium]MDY5754951.1 NAD(P)/FAD-dependent oxidoreductase [Eubacteriales bacterium]